MMEEYSSSDLMAAIVDLKSATENGFEQVKDRLDGHDRRFEDLEHRMNRRFDAVDKRFDRMDERFDRMDDRFDRMDKRFDELTGADRSHERRIQRLEDRVFGSPSP